MATNETDELLDAWDRWCDAMKSAARSVVVREHAPTDDPASLAAGFRFLARMAAMGIDQNFENLDPDAPIFWRSLGLHRKMGGDNPDALYTGCPIDPKGTYRIAGTASHASMVVFTVSRSRANFGKEGWSQFAGNHYGDEYETNPDGSFELFASVEPHEGNWLPLTDDAERITVRQAAGNWSTEAVGRWTIERVDRPAPQLPRFTPRDAMAALERAAAHTEGMGRYFADCMDAMQRHGWNQFYDEGSHARHGGVPGGVAVAGYFSLLPDEALIIEVTPPRCRYWNIQVGNYWYESFDYRYVPSSLNYKQAEFGDQGSVTIVLAHRDPGVQNWLSTGDLREGHMVFRWVEPESVPVPGTEVVVLDEWLRGHRANARQVTPAERAKEQHRRRLAVDQRFMA
jgi:hypothetical protein